MPDHVFGYGSLVATAGAIPCALRGHRRRWGVAMDNARAIPGYKVYVDPAGRRPDVCVAFLDVEPAGDGAAVGGACVSVDAAALETLDRRERNYDRIDVTGRVDGAPAGRVFAYVGRADARERLQRAREDGRAVVQRAYADGVEAAFRRLGPDALGRFHASTVPHGLPVLDLRRVDLAEPGGVDARPTASRVGSAAMGVIEGSSTAEIAAPLERCYELASDIDRISEWQKGVQRVEVVERDAQGRATVAMISTDAKVRTITTTVEFSYAEGPHRFSWRQRKGDLKALDGEWRFEADGDTTRATYHLVGDPGRVLGMLIRGPVEDRIRGLLIGERPDELKRRAEAG